MQHPSRPATMPSPEVTPPPSFMLRGGFSAYVLRSRPSQGLSGLMFSTNPAFRADDKAEAVTRQSFPSPPPPHSQVLSDTEARPKMGDTLGLRPPREFEWSLMVKRKLNLITVLLSSLSSLSDILGYNDIYLYPCIQREPDKFSTQCQYIYYIQLPGNRNGLIGNKP